MPCDTKLKRNQTLQQRATEVRRVVDTVAAKVSRGQVKVKVGPQGGIVFTGLDETERDGVTDNCLFRRLMVSGSALAKLAIERAEMLAGRKVDRQAVAQGLHYHSGSGWHNHRG